MEAILPISVAMPVAVTIPSPWPWVTTVDIYTILTRSANGISCLQSARNSASFSTGTDSPVREDSSTCRLELLVSRISAGTCAPASRSTRSPVTSSAAGISLRIPSRITIVCGLVSFFNASSAFRAFPSCSMPTRALTTTTVPMITASLSSPRKTDTTAAINNM